MRTPPNHGFANEGMAGTLDKHPLSHVVVPFAWRLFTDDQQVPAATGTLLLFPAAPFEGFGDKEEVFLFVDYLFCGIAERSERGKNPTSPIRGPWIRYPIPEPSRRGKGGVRKGPWAGMHVSDLVERRFAAIAGLVHFGMRRSDAWNWVATRLHGARVPAEKIDSIKTSYLQYSSPYRASCLTKWVSGFYQWLDWDIKANLIDRRIPLQSYIAHWKANAERWENDPQALRFMKRFKQLVPRAKRFVERRMEEEYGKTRQ